MAVLLNPTPVSKAMQSFSGIVDRVNRVFGDHVQLVADGIAFVWANPYGLSPQQAIAVIQQMAQAVGMTARQVYSLWTISSQYLNGIQPGCVASGAVPPGYEVAWNPDGSGMITTLVATTITISPATATVPNNTTQAFTASVLDQNGNPLTPQPTITWTATNGTIDDTGNYTAPATAGTDTVTATVGSLSATAAITIS